MTEPNQVRPIMKILNQVRELIIDAHNAGEQKGRKQVVDWVERNVGWRHDAPYKSAIDMHDWQAKLKEWGIE